MSAAEGTNDGGKRLPWWARAHKALMPDYNRRAATYWYTVVLLGYATIAWSGIGVGAMGPAIWIQSAVGIAIAMLAALFPVRIPRSTNSLAAGEIFIFLVLLLHGPSSATLAAAGEAAVGSLRTSRRLSSRLASPAMAAIAMYSSGTVLAALRATMTAHGYSNGGLLIIATMVFAVAYFVCNTLLVTTVPRLKANARIQLQDLLGVFGWLGIVYGGSAAVAALLYLAFRESGQGVLVAAIPIIALLLATLHFFFRHQEANEAARRAASDALAREAEVAARHMQELKASEQRFHSAFTHASIGMALLSFEGRILQANAALHEMLREPEGSLEQRGIDDYISGEDLGAMKEQIGRLNAYQLEDFTLELRFRRSDGEMLWAATHGSTFSEPGSPAACLILQVQDVTARREAEAGLHFIAFHDALTGLPNRRRFNEHLAAAIERAREDPRRTFALMFLDFDRFKLINDSLGHSAGDEFLVQVARRIHGCLRPHDVLSRLGGDEFAILAIDLAREEDAVALADRLMAALQKPFSVRGADLNVTASVGITFSSFGYESPDEALRDADIAMYKAKEAGKARHAIFDAGLHAEVARRLRLERDLRNALANAEMSLVYQPLFDLRAGELIGFEALARWNHRELGLVRPDVFIPIAEETGMIVQLTDFVLNQACVQLKTWQERDPAFAQLHMHVNISEKDIVHEAFVRRVMQAILGARLEPQRLTLELTETILMERIESALPALAQLQDVGVGLSVDDFGTGYSSLAHLSNLPIDTLKVDQSFVRELRAGSKDAKVVRAIVRLGASLDKAVVAEGIETESQLAQLRAMGCTRGQGFHLGRPQAAASIDLLLDRIVAREVPAFVEAASLERPTIIH
ncbi:MAG TPA: EAL domain-containing protein [Burkholderiaceae bacterium]|nr:EAL domain-containing protein [Burkholderiaceae bacterium]